MEAQLQHLLSLRTIKWVKMYNIIFRIFDYLHGTSYNMINFIHHTSIYDNHFIYLIFERYFIEDMHTNNQHTVEYVDVAEGNQPSLNVKLNYSTLQSAIYFNSPIYHFNRVTMTRSHIPPQQEAALGN